MREQDVLEDHEFYRSLFGTPLEIRRYGATYAGFEVPLEYYDDLDLWPLSLTECKNFFGQPAVCKCSQVTIIPKHALITHCKNCHTPLLRESHMDFIGPHDDHYHNSSLAGSPAKTFRGSV